AGTCSVTLGASRFSARRAAHFGQEWKALNTAQSGIELAPGQARSIILGHAPWIFSVTDGDHVGHAFGVLQQGRMRVRLDVTITADLPGEGAFWQGLQAYLATHFVDSCSVESITRPTAVSIIPRLPHETQRTSHVKLYTVDLTREEPFATLSTNHKRNISKARKHGARLVELPRDEAFQVHLNLMGLSLSRRRRRGEPTHLGADVDVMAALLRTGVARLFQAAVQSKVMSSKLVYVLDDAAYYHAGGTSPDGMELGVSHLLMYEIMQWARARGMRTLNLDVASAAAGGLGRYKEGFGPELWEVERVQTDGACSHGAIATAFVRLYRCFNRS
ncbi:MAG TPA: GNAT family N-acetyltransferase, partial [Burkholderiales bacterium]|nr:GNAT family N-acetyltransferase [Burkholderiales bacterium]